MDGFPGRRAIKWVLGLAGLAIFPAVSGAAVAPYTENFDGVAVGDTAVPNFTESTSTAYTVVGAGADHDYRASLSATSTSTTGVGASASSGIQLTNLGSGAPFTISTTATPVTITSGNTASTMNFGFGLFGTTANFSSNTEYRLLYATQTTSGNVGRLSLVRNGTTLTTGVVSGGTAVPPTVGQALTLTADISYVGSSMVINGSVTNGTNTATLTYTDATPLTGQFFGYRTAVNAVNESVTETVDYDNFRVVPEPASLGLLAAAAVPALLRRRQRVR